MECTSGGCERGFIWGRDGNPASFFGTSISIFSFFWSSLSRRAPNGSMTTCSESLISSRQKGQSVRPESNQLCRQMWQMRCPHGSRRMSLSFSAQILHIWKVEPISQQISYCSCVTSMCFSWVGERISVRSVFMSRPLGYKQLQCSQSIERNRVRLVFS